ncbi:MAG TPA: serine/threonine-protein kinase [Gemmatimonadaceae bacterium]|nr:serine/threonine-protein kinase [Gemmatimonadaceae bacterium]
MTDDVNTSPERRVPMHPELDRELWNRIASIFDRALEVHPSGRAALLDQVCGSDMTIRLEVEAMLEAHERDVGLLAEKRLSTAALEPSLAAGTRIGPYRIVSQIGAGGMGDVYRAERSDGAYRQAVALKVLRPGYRTAEMVRRFRIEREALARLVHPGIATILDGGALEDGRPYIVLELVDGIPITTYCAQRALGIRERLALFLKVASTVQFAHGRLVVHRDIKPSNILVQADGAPRLLDFGIAKLMDLEEEASLAGRTTPDIRLLTPEYAAPEQLRGEAPSVATDVYALGVLLFEMLAGAKPFPAAGRTVSELERAILESPAPPPSTLAASPAVRRALHGDLDRIVLMALRKEPERRYVSAAQFAEDVERYLAGRPVIARPDSVRYRTVKFVARNKALVAGSAMLAVMLLGFAATATMQARRIARERDRAERERVAADEVRKVLTGLIERGDPNKYPGGDTLRVTSLLDDAERAMDSMSGDSVQQAAMWRAVGGMRAARGEYARALALLRKAYERRLAIFGPDDVEAARIQQEIGIVTVSYAGEAAARPLFDSSLTTLRRLLGDENEDVMKATANLLMVTMDSVVTRELITRLNVLEQKVPVKDPIELAARLNSKGAERHGAHRYSEAAALYREAVDLLLKVEPPEHQDVRTVRRNLAMALVAGGRLAEAESLQRAAVLLEERLNGPPMARGMSREALALTMMAEGRPDSAEVHERQALRWFRAGTSPEHWRIWSAQRNLAFIVAALGRVDEGLTLLDTAIAVASTGPDSTSVTGYLTAQRIPLLLRLRRQAEALKSLTIAERRLGSSASVSPAHRADVHRYAGMAFLAAGDIPQAVERFRAAVTLVEAPERTNTEANINTCLLGVGLARLGRAAEARPMLDEPCRRYVAQGTPDPLILEWVASARAVALSS